MKVTRRNLLKVGAGAGAGLLLPLHLPTAANALTVTGITPFTEQLPTLGEIGVINGTLGVPIDISMVSASHSFHTNMKPTPTFAYRSAVPNTVQTQDYLGPVIVAKRGTPLTVNVTNSLGAHPLAKAMDYAIPGNVRADATHAGDAVAPRAAVHLHGGNTDKDNDGDPIQTFDVGQKKTYSYLNTQEAAGLWYHDHAMGITRLNVLAGLASGYLVRDDNDNGTGDRLPAPPYEVPLILQDRSFNKDGTFAYPWNTDTDRAWIPEFFGDIPTVNGKALPNLKVAQGKYRFRVYNGSQARFYNLRFVYGGRALPFFQIGTDGGLLDAPVPLTSLLIATGERADLVVDFHSLPINAKIILTNDAVTPYPSGGSTRADGGTPLPQIMRFTVDRTGGWVKALPTDLRAFTAPITRLDSLTPVQKRNIALVEVHNADGFPTLVTMNNRTFANDSQAPQVASNSLEEWLLINTTVDAHPMHLHYAQFQVMDRTPFNTDAYSIAAGYVTSNGATSTGADSALSAFPPPDVTSYLTGSATQPAANEKGWKDTILCPPGQVTRIRIPFGPDVVPGTTPGTFLPMAIGTAFTGDYVSHCHILEHEENDMMMRFKIV